MATDNRSKPDAPKIRDIDPTYIKEVLTPRIVTHAFQGKKLSEIADIENLQIQAVRRVMESDRYKDLLAHAAKGKFSQLVGLAADVIEDVLKTGSGRDKLNAAVIVLKINGLAEEQEKAQDTQLTIVLPGAAVPPKTYEIKNENDPSN